MNEKTFIASVLDYGVCPNTDEFVDAGIQKAIDDCFLSQGGEVVIPEGRYHIRGLRLRSNVKLHLLENAVLIGSRNPEDYFILKNDKIEPVPESELNEDPWEAKRGMPSNTQKFPGGRYNNGIIRIYKAENVSIIGEKGSIIDGMNCYDRNGEEYYRGPHGISVFQSENIHLKGYTIKDSANWAQRFFRSSGILVENVINIAGHDGVHFNSCNDIIVRNCEFYTGDDCVAGFNNYNLLVEDCIINTACNAFRVGGTNILIHHCNVFAPAKYLFRGLLTTEEKQSGVNANDIPGEHHRYNMLSFFTYYADLSVDILKEPSNIVVRDCTVSGADRFLHYNYSGNETWQRNKPLSDITFENITATDILNPLTAYGDKEHPFNMQIKNTEISFREGADNDTFLRLANYDNIRLKNVTVNNFNGKSLIKRYDGSNGGVLSLENISCGLKKENYVIDAKEAFTSQTI